MSYQAGGVEASQDYPACGWRGTNVPLKRVCKIYAVSAVAINMGDLCGLVLGYLLFPDEE